MSPSSLVGFISTVLDRKTKFTDKLTRLFQKTMNNEVSRLTNL